MSHPHTKDWSGTCVYADPCVGTTRRAVLKLEETLTEEVEKLAEKGIRPCTPLYLCPGILFSPQQVKQL